MTITNTPLYGLALPDDDTPLVDLALAVRQASAATEAALIARGIVPPGATDLTAEANSRATADAALSTRLTAVEAGAWTTLTLTSPVINYTGTVGGTPGQGVGPYDVPAARVEGKHGVLRGWLNTPTQLAAGTPLWAALPVALRPAKSRILFVPVDGVAPGLQRCELATDGRLYAYRAVPAGSYLNLDDLSWSLT